MNKALSPSTRLPGLYTNWLRPDFYFDRNFFGLESGFVPMRAGVNVPPVNIKETPEDYTLEIAAPGLQRKDLTVEVENHKLKISADKEEEKEKTSKPEGVLRKEYSWHSFSRCFDLPDNVKGTDIDARYENGILKIHVPKAKDLNIKPAQKILVA